MQKHVLQQGERQQFGVTGFWERWGAEFPALSECWALSCMGRTLGVASADLLGVVWVGWVSVHPFHCPLCLGTVIAQHLPQSMPNSVLYLLKMLSLWKAQPAALNLHLNTSLQEAFVTSGLFGTEVGTHLGCWWVWCILHSLAPSTAWFVSCSVPRVGTLGPFLENSLAWSPQAWILFMLTVKCKIKLFRQS